MSIGFSRLLAALDLSPLASRVTRRLALLPLAEGARLTLLHVVPDGLPLRAQRAAERDAKIALRDEVQSLAGTLPKSVVVDHVVRVGVAATEISASARSTKAQLIVMGRGSGRALRDLVLGSTAERVIRRGQLPVLAVRRPPHAPYARPAVALALDEAAHEVLALLIRAIPRPRPRVTIIHALGVPFTGLVYPSLSEGDAERLSESHRRRATEELGKVVAAALARAKVPPDDVPRWDIIVRHGAPRLIIEKVARKRDIDLLALGTHGYAGLAHMFLGTVAGDVLRTVTSDVLVVPPRTVSPRRR